MLSSDFSDATFKSWHIVHRWQEYGAEFRANVVRVLAIAAFYSVQLYDFAVRKATSADFHRSITTLAVAWVAVSLFSLACLRRRYLPPWLKYATTLADVVMLTLMLLVAHGPQSPLIVAYFVILVLAALRFSLPLIRMATVACLASYLIVLAGCHPDWLGNEQRSFTVPQREELIVVLAIGFAGIVLGQIARRAREIAFEFSSRAGGAS